MVVLEVEIIRFFFWTSKVIYYKFKMEKLSNNELLDILRSESESVTKKYLSIF